MIPHHWWYRHWCSSAIVRAVNYALNHHRRLCDVFYPSTLSNSKPSVCCRAVLRQHQRYTNQQTHHRWAESWTAVASHYRKYRTHHQAWGSCNESSWAIMTNTTIVLQSLSHWLITNWLLKKAAALAENYVNRHGQGTSPGSSPMSGNSRCLGVMPCPLCFQGLRPTIETNTKWSIAWYLTQHGNERGDEMNTMCRCGYKEPALQSLFLYAAVWGHLRITGGAHDPWWLSQWCATS